MKRTLTSFHIGKKFIALVDEVVGPNEFIVNFQGDLMRVKNKSREAFKVGDRVTLIVSSLEPLGFKIEKFKKIPGSFSMSV